MKYILVGLALIGSSFALAIDARVEGSYEVSLGTTSDQGDLGCPATTSKTFLNILDSGNLGGIVVSVGHPESAFAIFNFSVLNGNEEGTMLQGNSYRFGGNAEFKFTINPDEGTLTGAIANYNDGCDYQVSGRAFHTLASMTYGTTVAVSKNEVLGTYQGKINGVAGSLVIKRRLLGSESSLVAAFNSGYGSNFGFQQVTLFEATGALELIHFNPATNFYLKMTLGHRYDSTGKLFWKGMAINSSGNKGFPSQFGR